MYLVCPRHKFNNLTLILKWTGCVIEQEMLHTNRARAVGEVVSQCKDLESTAYSGWLLLCCSKPNPSERVDPQPGYLGYNLNIWRYLLKKSDKSVHCTVTLETSSLKRPYHKEDKHL